MVKKTVCICKPPLWLVTNILSEAIIIETIVTSGVAGVGVQLKTMLIPYTDNNLIIYLNCMCTSSSKKIAVFSLDTTYDNMVVIYHIFSKYQVGEQVSNNFKTISPYQVTILHKLKPLYINLHGLPLCFFEKRYKPGIYMIHDFK